MTTYNMSGKWTYIINDSDEVLTQSRSFFADTMHEVMLELQRLADETVDIHNEYSDTVHLVRKFGVKSLDWKCDMNEMTFKTICRELGWDSITVTQVF